MTESSNNHDTSFHRKKATRSCLNCQKSHRTCENQRPCMECKRRGVTGTCVDGKRKIPKYLHEKCATSRSRSTDPGHCDSGSQIHSTTHRDHANGTHFWTHSSSSAHTIGDIFSKARYLNASYSAEKSLNHYVDPAYLHIENPILVLSQRMDESSLSPKDRFQPQILADATGIQSLARPLRVTEGHGHGNIQCGRTIIGFTISSGWSSTFLPSGITAKSGEVNI